MVLARIRWVTVTQIRHYNLEKLLQSSTSLWANSSPRWRLTPLTSGPTTWHSRDPLRTRITLTGSEGGRFGSWAWAHTGGCWDSVNRLAFLWVWMLAVYSYSWVLDVSKVRNKGRVVPSALLEEHYAPCFKPYEKATAGSVWFVKYKNYFRYF